jgi:hypothetical protein
MMLESHFPSLFQIIPGFFCATDLNLESKWAGLLLIDLLLGLGGWLLSHFPPCVVYRGSLGLLGFGPLVDHRDIGFGPPWTEKMGLYNIIFTSILTS